jgi:hypothetical protein
MPVTTPVILEREPGPAKPLPQPKRPKSIKAEPDSTDDAELTEPVTVIVSNQSAFLMQVADSIARRSADPVTIIEIERFAGAGDFPTLAALTTTEIAVSLGEHPTDWIKGRVSTHIEVLTSSPPVSGRHVPALPDPALQIDLWLQHFPDAQRIGAVISEGHLPYAQGLSAAAEAAGIDFSYRIAANDQAAQVEFRRLTAQVDGLFLLPDPAIFNPDLIRDVVAHSRHNGLRLLAYNSFMHALGVDLVLTPEPDDVAIAVLELIRNPQRDKAWISTFTVTTPVSRQAVSRQAVSRQLVSRDE